ncbi:hypothetical protein KC316_g3850 [Hortaea werneckii]|nr:hypothetical protein KC324_g3574 [Hortaea werneckii]KAI7589586.1 hypothetical protein KC316_g3850 [Hortaea werneckii]
MAKGLRSLWKDSDVRKIDAEIDFFVARLNFYCSWSSSKLDPRNQDFIVTIQQQLAPPDPFVNLHKALKLRSANTGKWYLQGTQFEACKAQSSYFGWLHGSAGSGKTILSASIIDGLQQFCSEDPARIPDAAQRLSTTASEQQLLNALRDTMETLPMPFIVLDALDECNNRERLFEILKEIQSWGNKSLHMLMTSRKEVDIEDVLEDLVLSENRTCLESHLVDEDIRTYVHERLTEDKSFRRWQGDPEIQEEIEQILGKQACGMFRWAACQLDTLAHCLTRGKVRHALRDLPKTLYDTYDRMIRTLDESQNGKEALKVLRWLAYSRRPLSAEELLEVTGIVLEDDDPRFDEDDVFQDLRDISRICLSLVSIVPAVQDYDVSGDESEIEDALSTSSGTKFEPEREYIRLAHFSVKEYLISTRPCLEQFSLQEKESNDILATCCLIYLHRFEGQEWNDPECEAKFPLARYAASYWTTHARISDCQSQRQLDLCMKFLTVRPPAYRSWHRFYDMSEKWNRTCNIRREIPEFPEPLFSASGEGLLRAVHAILEGETIDIDAAWELGGSALCEASRMGYGRIVEMLLAKGANPNIQRHQGPLALVKATRYGEKKIVEMLLDAGADVHAKARHDGTALDVALKRGDKEMMEILLAKDANFEGRGECYGQALIKASRWRHKDIVEMLLAHGADFNARSLFGRTALAVASEKGHVKIAEILLAHGADANAKSTSEEIVEMLLAHGVAIEPRGKDARAPTPLQRASERGNRQIVQMLLANGADVNAPKGRYGSALFAASFRHDEEIVQMLKAEGARLQEGEQEAILKWKHDSDSLPQRSISSQPCPPGPDEL